MDPLKHSRRVCGGILADIKKLVKRYPSDIKDMFHFQVGHNLLSLLSFPLSSLLPLPPPSLLSISLSSLLPLSSQVFFSIIFLYIAYLAPAVAFGGLMEEVTGNLIGETETLLMTGLAGMFYGLAACQPLTILAFTGPLLLFEEVVFSVSVSVYLYLQ